MANLPTAYASQRFGNRTLDFYAATGEVLGADPRARGDERRLQDIDGARHVVRLMEAKFDLEPGDQASVLRLQPGPARRSRPVAVINHTRGGWTRTHPGASALLSRAGVARNVNWALTMTLFTLAALVCVWPYMAAFLAEIAPAAFAAVPAYDVFALAAAAAPGFADWSWAALTAPLAAQIAGTGLAPVLPAAAFAAAAVLGAVIVFSARSWRLLWAPLFVAALGVGALGFAGPEGALVPALSGLGLAALVFMIGGVWNRVSDAVRLESRIALLADHLLTNAPEELVTDAQAPEETAAPEAGREETRDEEDVLVSAGAAAAVASSLRSLDGDQGDAAREDAPQDDGETPDAPDAEAEAVADAGSVAEPDAETEVVSEAEGETGTEGRAEAERPLEAEGAKDGEGGEPAPEAGELDIEAALKRVADAAQGETAQVEGETADSGEPAGDETQAAPAEAGEAQRPDTPAPAGLDAEEAERLRTDPRYAARAIILPPPPPMPAPRQDGDTAGRELEPAGAAAPGLRTLNPGRPLPDNVVPIFAAPPPTRDQGTDE